MIKAHLFISDVEEKNSKVEKESEESDKEEIDTTKQEHLKVFNTINNMVEKFKEVKMGSNPERKNFIENQHLVTRSLLLVSPTWPVRT